MLKICQNKSLCRQIKLGPVNDYNQRLQTIGTKETPEIIFITLHFINKQLVMVKET